jgi:hypothetical protein|tara:strand:+ start:3449 stop:3949 length:501 start_codon:yes stop_codon:yes gene_type:complete
MKKRKMNKRGGILDLFVLVFVVFAFALIAIIGSRVFENARANLENNTQISSTNASMEILYSTEDRYNNLFDGLVITIFVLLLVGVGVGAYFSNTHPAMFFISIFVLLFVLVITAVFANTFDTMADQDSLTTAVEEFTFTSFLFDNYLLMIGVAAIIIMVLLYTRFS